MQKESKKNICDVAATEQTLPDWKLMLHGASA